MVNMLYILSAMLRVSVLNKKNEYNTTIYIYIYMFNTANKSLSPPPINKVKSTPTPIRVTPPKDEGGVVTNISKDDAKNALAGLFGARKSSPSKPKPSSDDGGVVTNINKDDAKNALAGLFGARKPGGLQKAKSAMVLPKPRDDGTINLKITTPPRLLKYEKLSKIMPVHVLENRMKMDGITKMLIGQITKR